MRIDDADWEGLGVFAQAHDLDRTKVMNAFIDVCLGRPGAHLPSPLSPRVFARLLSDALSEARAEFDAATDAQRRETLQRRVDGLAALLDEVNKRVSGS